MLMPPLNLHISLSHVFRRPRGPLNGRLTSDPRVRLYVNRTIEYECLHYHWLASHLQGFIFVTLVNFLRGCICVSAEARF